MVRTIQVAEHYRSCATRDRGAKFYPILLKALEDSPGWDRLVVSFEDVEFVTPSFLDETVIQLAESHPQLAQKVVVRGLSEFAVCRLRRVLERRGLSWTLDMDASGGFRLGA